jgi:hypothetical protein
MADEEKAGKYHLDQEVINRNRWLQEIVLVASSL